MNFNSLEYERTLQRQLQFGIVRTSSLEYAGAVAIKVGVSHPVEWLLKFQLDLHAALSAVEVGLGSIQKYNRRDVVQLGDFAVEDGARRQSRLILDAVALRRIVALGQRNRNCRPEQR